MRHIRSTIVAAAMLALMASDGRGQVITVQTPKGEPQYWVTGGVSFYDLRSFAGGVDGAFWDFDNGFQLRGTIERRIRRDMTAGLAGTYSRLPLDITEGGCGGCPSDVDMWQGFALLRLASSDGYGFYNALELMGGVARFENFADAGAGEPTEPYRSLVPSFAASYGLGYSFWRGFDVALVQELGFLIYSPVEGSSSTSTPGFTSTRLEARYSWR